MKKVWIGVENTEDAYLDDLIEDIKRKGLLDYELRRNKAVCE